MAMSVLELGPSPKRKDVISAFKRLLCEEGEWQYLGDGSQVLLPEAYVGLGGLPFAWAQSAAWHPQTQTLLVSADGRLHRLQLSDGSGALNPLGAAESMDASCHLSVVGGHVWMVEIMGRRSWRRSVNEEGDLGTAVEGSELPSSAVSVTSSGEVLFALGEDGHIYRAKDLDAWEKCTQNPLPFPDPTRGWMVANSHTLYCADGNGTGTLCWAGIQADGALGEIAEGTRLPAAIYRHHREVAARAPVCLLASEGDLFLGPHVINGASGTIARGEHWRCRLDPSGAPGLRWERVSQASEFKGQALGVLADDKVIVLQGEQAASMMVHRPNRGIVAQPPGSDEDKPTLFLWIDARWRVSAELASSWNPSTDMATGQTSLGMWSLNPEQDITLQALIKPSALGLIIKVGPSALPPLVLGACTPHRDAQGRFVHPESCVDLLSWGGLSGFGTPSENAKEAGLRLIGPRLRTNKPPWIVGDLPYVEESGRRLVWTSFSTGPHIGLNGAEQRQVAHRGRVLFRSASVWGRPSSGPQPVVDWGSFGEDDVILFTAPRPEDGGDGIVIGERSYLVLHRERESGRYDLLMEV